MSGEEDRLKGDGDLPQVLEDRHLILNPDGTRRDVDPLERDVDLTSLPMRRGHLVGCVGEPMPVVIVRIAEVNGLVDRGEGTLKILVLAEA